MLTNDKTANEGKPVERTGDDGMAVYGDWLHKQVLASLLDKRDSLDDQAACAQMEIRRRALLQKSQR